MNETLQYIIVFALFLIAIFVVIKPFFGKKKNDVGCKKGCGCDVSKSLENK